MNITCDACNGRGWTAPDAIDNWAELCSTCAGRAWYSVTEFAKTLGVDTRTLRRIIELKPVRTRTAMKVLASLLIAGCAAATPAPEPMVFRAPPVVEVAVQPPPPPPPTTPPPVLTPDPISCDDLEAQMVTLKEEFKKQRDEYIAQHCVDTSHRRVVILKDGTRYVGPTAPAWICDGQPTSELPIGDKLPAYKSIPTLGAAIRSCRHPQ